MCSFAIFTHIPSMHKFLIILITTIMISSCGQEAGNVVTGDNLSVYFVTAEDEPSATLIALYWKNEGLITGEKQDLKIERDGENLSLKLIYSELPEKNVLAFNERKLLMELQNKLNDSIFPDENLVILLCDNDFKTIININK